MKKSSSSSLWRLRLAYLGQRMVRQKDVSKDDMKTELRRCLSLPQLALIGVGNTIGVGIYVMLGQMAKENAGPSVIFSFIVAIFVTLMNALSFAEFASCIPQTGASYIYIYKIFGEFVAFLCGWVMIISMILTCSVGARAWSGMLDSFFGNAIEEFTISTFGEIQFGLPFAKSLDIVAFLFQIAIIIIVSCNVLCSSIINSILSILTSSVLIFVFVTGLIFGEAKNFLNEDNGGLFPFGIAGVVKGASLALYAMSGFEIVALSAEEAKNPAKAVPRAMVLELLLVGTVYIGAAIGMLFLIPYWLIDLRSPLPSAFEHSGLKWGKMIVTIGPLFGITNLQMLGMYGQSRVMYRMAKDGLFFQSFLKVHKKTGVPLNSVLSVGVLTSLCALLLDLSSIVQITVLLMLINYIIVGSALIKMKTNDREKAKGDEGDSKDIETREEPRILHEDDFYNQEIIISEYETCSESAGVDSSESGQTQPLRRPTDTLVDVDDKAESRQTSNEIDAASETLVPRSTENEVTNGAVSTKNETIANSSELVWKEDGLFRQLPTEVNTANATAKDLRTNTNNSATTESGKLLSDSDTDSKLRKESDMAEGPTTACNSHKRNMTCRDWLTSLLSPFVPGVISVNALIFLHWLCCMVLAMQISLGWADFRRQEVVAVLSVTILLVLLLIFSLMLWCHCGSGPATGFQTPLMPLVPTLSVLTSAMLMFSAGEMLGYIEMAILIVSGAVVYVLMVFLNYSAEASKTVYLGSSDERKSLVRADANSDEADDEDEDDDEL